MKYVWSLRIIGNIFTFIVLTWIIGFFRSHSSLISRYSFGGYIFKDELTVFLIIMVVCTAIGVISEYRANKISKKITEKKIINIRNPTCGLNQGIDLNTIERAR